MFVDHPIEFLPAGATKPLLALDENEQKVVIKAMIHPTYGKMLLNEYLTGNLATSIELPWPNTQLATLGSRTVNFFRMNSHKVYSLDCVAINFVKDLEPIDWPNPPTEQNKWEVGNFHLLPDANRKHLTLYFNNPEKQSAFYGKALFENWLFMQDTKYDTLFTRSNRAPFFLDGSHAFRGINWEFEQMDYSRTDVLSFSPYCQGILTELNLYEEWLQRIEQISDSYIKSLFDSIPQSWGVTEKQLDFLFSLLTEKRKIFVANCREEIEWQRQSKDFQ